MLCRYCLCRQSKRAIGGLTWLARYSTGPQSNTTTTPFPRPYTLPPQQSPAREANLKESGVTLPGTPSTISTPLTADQKTDATVKRKRPARPRKAVLSLTPDAVARLKEIQSSDGKYIKVSVVAKGCAGGAYKLEYVDSAGRFDEKVQQDGVTVLVDSKSLMKIIGSEMDYTDDLLASRFTFNNPNVVSTCGCEESFATKEDEERLLGHGRV